MENLNQPICTDLTTEYTRRVAVATFCHICHHDGKIGPAWWGCGAHPPPFTLFTITYKLWYIRSSWEGRYTPFIFPLPLYVLCGINWSGNSVLSSMYAVISKAIAYALYFFEEECFLLSPYVVPAPPPHSTFLTLSFSNFSLCSRCSIPTCQRRKREGWAMQTTAKKRMSLTLYSSGIANFFLEQHNVADFWLCH